MKGRRSGALILMVLLAQCSCQPSGGASSERQMEGHREIVEACERSAHAAASANPIPDVSAGPGHAALQRLLRPVYECRAIAEDSEAPCSGVDPLQFRNCRARWMFFHEARRAADTANWPALLAPALREDCLSADGGAAETICTQIESAVSLQEPERCPQQSAGLYDLCVGLATSDPARCAADSLDCIELAGRLVLLRQGGLKRVAESGTRRDRIHARAALGELDACQPVIDAFKRDCSAWEK